MFLLFSAWSFHWAAGCRSLSLAREQFHLGLARTRWLCVCVTAIGPLPSFLYLPTCGCSLRLCIPGVPPCYTHGNSVCFFFLFWNQAVPQSNLTCAGSEGVLLLPPERSDVTCSSRRRVRDEIKCNVSNVIFNNGLTVSF